MANQRVVFTYGRLNPPTTGHQVLINAVVQQARSASAYKKLFLSHTQDRQKNPLAYIDKVRYVKMAFGNQLEVVTTPYKTIIEIMQSLAQEGFEYVTMIVGSDRVAEFSDLLKHYNGREYRFQAVHVLSAGLRDPDDTGAAGMSASKLRGYAVQGNLALFKTGCPEGLPLAERTRMYYDVRAGLGLKESASVEKRFEGTNSIVQTYKDDTPGEPNIDEMFGQPYRPLWQRVRQQLVAR